MPPCNSLRYSKRSSRLAVLPLEFLTVKERTVSAANEGIKKILAESSYLRIRGLGFILSSNIFHRVKNIILSRVVSVVRTADIWWTALNAFMRWVCYLLIERKS